MTENDPGGTSLSRLRIDTNNSFVGAPDVDRIERKIRKRPRVLVFCLFPIASRESFFDCVLMRPAEGTSDQLAAYESINLSETES